MSSPTGLAQAKVQPVPLARRALVYIRQSSPKPVRENIGSQLNQRALVDRACQLGWLPARIEVLDGDLGQSGAASAGRQDFQALTAAVALGQVGIVLGWEVLRLARNHADWHQLLDLAALFGTLMADAEGVYDPRAYNDRLLRGLKGTMSEAELDRLRERLTAGRLSRVRRGEYVQRLPTGRVRLADGRVEKDPDVQVRQAIELVFTQFAELGSGQRGMRYFKPHGLRLPRRQTGGLPRGNCSGASPPRRPSTRSSRTRRMPGPSSTAGGRPTPRAGGRGSRRPASCASPSPSGAPSIARPIRPTFRGNSTSPTARGWPTTPNAMPSAGVVACPARAPPCCQGSPPAGRAGE